MNDTLLCITTYNQLETTKRCLSSVEGQNVDILVIDDCSTDDTKIWLWNSGYDYRHKRNRRGLTDSWNSAYKKFKKSSYKYLIISNNDVIIPHGAIESMKSEHTLVVPMTTYEGAGYASKGQSITHYIPLADIGNLDDANEVQYLLSYREPHFIPIKSWTGFFMMFTRDIIQYEREDGNLFDPLNINVGNDDDIARRVKAHICTSAFIWHEKGVSFNKKIGRRNNI